VVSSELDISTFYNIVKKLVHQAGTNLFVNRVMSATANVSANVSVVTRQNVYADLFSTFSTLETVAKLVRKSADADNVSTTENTVYTITKPLEDSTTISDTITISMYKVSTDDTTLSDNNSFTFSRTQSDSATATDLVEDYTDNTGALGYFLETYAATTSISFS
jgi:hypothetical protein